MQSFSEKNMQFVLLIVSSNTHKDFTSTLPFLINDERFAIDVWTKQGLKLTGHTKLLAW